MMMNFAFYNNLALEKVILTIAIKFAVWITWFKKILCLKAFLTKKYNIKHLLHLFKVHQPIIARAASVSEGQIVLQEGASFSA